MKYKHNIEIKKIKGDGIYMSFYHDHRNKKKRKKRKKKQATEKYGIICFMRGNHLSRIRMRMSTRSVWSSRTKTAI